MQNFYISLLALLLSSTGTLANDVVILNGCVMDTETTFDDVANVAIKDGHIVAIIIVFLQSRFNCQDWRMLK